MSSIAHKAIRKRDNEPNPFNVSTFTVDNQRPIFFHPPIAVAKEGERGGGGGMGSGSLIITSTTTTTTTTTTSIATITTTTTTPRPCLISTQSIRITS